MPEGPEIRRAADRIARALVATSPERVEFGLPRLQSWSEHLTGERIDAVEPRGKALLIRFANQLNIYSHNQLYGRWYVQPAGKLPKTGRQLRLAIHTPKRWALLYSASDIAVLHDEDLPTHPFLQRLGPDVLVRDVTAAQVRARLDDKAFCGRALGTLLLDQGFVCGLGNYLRSEILFVSRLMPELRPKDLGEQALDGLAANILRIARRAYRTGGITNDADDVRTQKAAGVPRRHYRHFVFARAGMGCRLCGEPIQKTDHGSRRLYFCVICQAAQGSDRGPASG